MEKQDYVCENSKYESAKRLALQGFYVFPLIAHTKKPAIKNWQLESTRDIDKITDWWINSDTLKERQFNIGINTSKFGDSESLIVIDVDNKNNKNGFLELDVLSLTQGYTIVDTIEQTTPSNGKHIIYRSPKPKKQGTNLLGQGLDVRSNGGYIVGAGSIFNGIPYKTNSYDKTPSYAPTWLLELLSDANEKTQKISDKKTLNEDNVIFYATLYLLNEAPLAVEGNGGDETTFKVAANVRDFGVSITNCFNLMKEFWNDRCSPPWTDEELHVKIKNAYRYSKNILGIDSPERDFDTEEIEKEKEENTFKINPNLTISNFKNEMNKNHAVVYDDSSHSILYETLDRNGNKKRKFLNELTFKRMYSKYKVKTGKSKNDVKSYADLWLDWKEHREYNGVAFLPEKEAQYGYYNLWRGFTCNAVAYDQATKKQKEGLEIFLDHAKNNVCNGDEKLFLWLMGYFAHLIQKPYERPLSTIVFKGSKGVGKNALIDRVGKLLGHSHYLVAHDSRYLTSNFNGHLDSCLMLVLDEAFWSGDKKAESTLKGLTTSPEILIERKGKEPYTVDNLVRLVIIGNEEWLVPASHDERRYAVFQVGENRKQDTAYFTKMRMLLDEEGGNQLLLHYLQTFDLSNIDLNTTPKTDALLAQKIQSADPMEAWWMECLANERIEVDFEDGWVSIIDKNEMRNAFTRYCKNRNIKSWIPPDNVFSKKLKRMCKSIDCDQLIKDGNRRTRKYVVPDIEQARSDFDSYIGHKIKWNEV